MVTVLGGRWLWHRTSLASKWCLPEKVKERKKINPSWLGGELQELYYGVLAIIDVWIHYQILTTRYQGV